MKGKNFTLSAMPFLSDAYCECGNNLKEVSNGWFSKVWYCIKCKYIYELKLIKMPKKKLNKDFMVQCEKESAPKRENHE